MVRISKVWCLRVGSILNQSMRNLGNKKCKYIALKKGHLIVIMNRNTTSTFSERWDDILYNMIDYPSIEFLYNNFDQNFISQLPILDEGFIHKILIEEIKNDNHLKRLI